MANIKEKDIWEDHIYQIETSDPVLGGENGIANRQAKQLASRTQYLKKGLEKSAAKDSPAFTGEPTAPTAPQGTNSQQIATTAFVKAAIAALIGSAPAELDTLEELAAMLAENGDLRRTLLQKIAEKAPLSHSHTISQITNLQSTLDAKANTNSPAFSGVPTAPTAPQSTNNQQIATTAFVKAAIAALVGSAPATLDTLAELATALGQDANFRTTVLNLIASKADSSHTHTANQITDFVVAVSNVLNTQFTYQKFGNIEVTRLPDGTMVQRGYYSERLQDYFKQVIFPIAFAETPIVLSAARHDGAYTQSGVISSHVGNITTTSFYMGVSENAGNGSGAYWQAVGRWK